MLYKPQKSRMDLIEAAKNGRVEKILTLLESGVPANTRDKDNATALYWSACYGHDDVTEILISAQCDVNATVRWGSSALHAAADRGHLQSVQILINSGANINGTNNRGDTPLHIAAYRGFMEITRLLLLSGSNVNLKNEKGKTPEEEALEGGNTDIAECIRVFVTEGHFSLSNGRHQNTTFSNSRFGSNRTRNNTIICNSQTRSIPAYDNTHFGSISSECSTDVTESTTSSINTSSSGFPEDFVDSVAMPEAAVKAKPNVQLKRSISFGGTNHGPQSTFSHPSFPIALRTASAETIQRHDAVNGPMMRNYDVTSTYPADNYIPSNRFCVSEGNVFQNGFQAVRKDRYSDSTNHVPVTSNGQCIATESIDYNVAEHLENNEMIPQLRRHGIRTENGVRPQRFSVGSMREMVHQNKDHEIAMLQNQLVNSYKCIESLTKENENLKFKSSTLLERLTETETQLSAMTVKCETLAELLEKEKRHMPIVQQDQTMKPPQRLETSIDDPIGGFRELAKRFAKKPNELETRLQETLQSVSSQVIQHESLVVQNNEWLPGVDYVILGDPPISAPVNKQLPKFVSFLVKHVKTNNCFILKMAIELQTSESYQVLSQDTKSNRVGPKNYCSQPNLIKILHKFEAPTDRLKKFVYIPPFHNSSLPQRELASRTTFLVTPYMLTLRKLVDMFHDSQIVSSNNDSNMVFWILTIYQLVSVILILEDQHRNYEDMDEDNIGFDEDLVPYLKNIENVLDISLCPKAYISEKQTLDVDLKTRGPCAKDDQCTMQKDSPYNDIMRLSKLFNDILFTSNTGKRVLFPAPTQNGHAFHGANHVTSLGGVLRHILSDAKEPTSCLFDESNTARNVLKRLGFVMFGSGAKTVANETDCFVNLQSRRLQLLSEISNRKRSKVHPGVYASVEESIRTNRLRIEYHFLSHVTSKELWTLCTKFAQKGLDVDRTYF